MNTGVEILLQRMKDCPEDFYYQPHTGGMSRWRKILEHAFNSHILTQEETDAFNNALKEVERERFTEMVMKELAGEGEVSDEGKPNPYLAPSATGLGGAIQGLSSIQNQAYNNLTLGTNGAGQLAWANTGAVTGTINAGSLKLGNTELSEAGLEQMLATHRAMREQTKPKHWWNKTLPELFGRK